LAIAVLRAHQDVRSYFQRTTTDRDVSFGGGTVKAHAHRQR
jgi:hypothetical protein